MIFKKEISAFSATRGLERCLICLKLNLENDFVKWIGKCGFLGSIGTIRGRGVNMDRKGRRGRGIRACRGYKGNRGSRGGRVSWGSGMVGWVFDGRKWLMDGVSGLGDS